MCASQALKEFDLYDDTHRLRITVSNMKNGNSRRKLEEIKTAVLKGLSKIAPAPGAQFAQAPPRHRIVCYPTQHLLAMGCMLQSVCVPLMACITACC